MELLQTGSDHPLNPLTIVSEKKYNQTDRLSLLFASICGGTTGLVIGGSINTKASWPMHILPIFLAANWLVSPFRPHEEFNEHEMREKKIYRIACLAFGMLLGFSLFYVVCQFVSPFNQETYSTSLKTILYCLQDGFLALNFLSCYQLHKLTPLAKRISCISKAKGIFVMMESVINKYFSQEAVYAVPSDQDLIQQTRTLKVNNLEKARQIEGFKKFISSDPDLISSYEECRRKTEHILLPDPERNQSPPQSDPMLEELRREMHNEIYLNSTKTRIKDFLDKNPTFSDLVRTKLEQMNPSLAVEWTKSES